MTETVYRLPPESLIKLCTPPEYRGHTNGEYQDHGDAALAFLTDCNRQNHERFGKWLENNR